MTEDEDYYLPWEWQPIKLMPDGCNEVVVEYADSSTGEICSCDYWHSLAHNKSSIVGFRFK